MTRVVIMSPVGVKAAVCCANATWQNDRASTNCNDADLLPEIMMRTMWLAGTNIKTRGVKRGSNGVLNPCLAMITMSSGWSARSGESHGEWQSGRMAVGYYTR